jgi:hypothetical protein
MSLRFITSAALALGLSAAVPTIASADRRPEPRGNQRAPAVNVERHDSARPENRGRVELDHRDGDRHEQRGDRDDHRDRDGWHDRDEHWGVGVYVPAPVYVPDFSTPVSVQSVPRCVVDAASRVEPGLPIESVDYIRQGGSLFYSVRMERPHAGDVIVRVGVDGTLIGIQ